MERHNLASGFNLHLGMEFVRSGSDEVIIRLPIRPELLQPYGIVHGGVWSALVETAASVGAALWHDEHGAGETVGVSNTTDFLRAVREGTVVARAIPVHRGRLQQLWQVEIRDEEDRLVARGQVRLQNLPTARDLGRRAVQSAPPTDR